VIAEFSRAAANGRLESALLPYLHPHMLVIDELGDLFHAADAANVLYDVVNERYLARA
jgi:DNA replication protein DnaC